MKKVGLFLAGVWIIGSILLTVTAQEMEILLALNFAAIGGFGVVSYFLLTWVISKYRKKERYRLQLVIFGIWLLAPVLFIFSTDLIQTMDSAKHENFLENNVPTEELIKNVTEGYSSPFVNEANPFFFYKNRELVLVYEINKEQVLAHFRELVQNTKMEDIDEVVIEDFIGRQIMSVHLLHSSIWHETRHPHKISIQLYFEGELFYETTSVEAGEAKMDDFLAKHKELYEIFKSKVD
ncbi:hypothetical protein ACLM5H_21375 [Fredinandcohnia humi]